MENKIQLLTIGIIGNNNTFDIIETLRQLVRQDYPEIEVIISINRTSGIEVADSVEYIRSYSKDNLKNVIVNFSEKEMGLVEHAHYIYEKSNGEYLLYIPAGDLLWTGGILSLFIDDFWDIFGALRGGTVLYDGSRYIGRNSKEDFEYSYCFRRKMIATEMFNEQIPIWKLLLNIYNDIGEKSGIAESSCFLIKHDIKNQHMDIAKDVNVFEDWNLREIKAASYLNQTNLIKLQGIIEEFKNNKQSGITAMGQEVRDILHYRSRGKWGRSLSDETMLYCLAQLTQSDNLENINLLIEKNKNNKIKIVAICDEFSIWQSCIQSIYQEIAGDGRFEIKLVYVPFEHINKDEQDVDKNLKNYKDAGLELVLQDQYDVAAESPDCIIYTKPYELPDGWDIKDISKAVPKTIYIPYSMLSEHESKELLNISYQLPLHVLVWKRLSYSVAYTEEIKKYAYNKENYLCTGHPRFDLTIKDMGNREQELYQLLKEKAGDRKVFFWNSHFELDRISDGVARSTFPLFGEKILDYFKKNSQNFLIWRPHPFFWNSLAKKTKNPEIKQDYQEKLKKYDNIYLDSQKSYYPALFASDALISDNSSLIAGYLSTYKPVIFTKRRKEEADEENVYLYYGYTFEELLEFMQEISVGNDIKKEIRKEYVKQNFYLSPHEKCAHKLLETIIES